MNKGLADIPFLNASKGGLRMAADRTISTNRKIVALMLLAGGALLAYAIFHSSKGTSFSSWEPVNEPLKAAIENLQNKHEPDFMKSSTIPSDYFSSKKQEATKGNTKEAGASKEGTAIEEISKGKSDNRLTIENKATKSSALLDLDHASQEELETLPGIGPSKAKAIISFREQHNGFNSLEQLLEVKGIGPKALERISKLVRISTTK
jgi:competence protein ComEA